MALWQTFIRIVGWVRFGQVLGHASSKRNPSFQVSNFAMRKSDWWFDWHEHPSEKRRDENSNVANEQKLVSNFSPIIGGTITIYLYTSLSSRVLSEVVLFVFQFKKKQLFTMKTLLTYSKSLSFLAHQSLHSWWNIVIPGDPDRLRRPGHAIFGEAWLFAASQYTPSKGDEISVALGVLFFQSPKDHSLGIQSPSQNGNGT